ncbi:hypothetical protein C2S53_012808 [Perilla frutescens var. hirtella]|uniref:Uncharacterized protein n=1 Tax=Perilla frutescens var. hirtella TaxID=608512 RepID=A0AAD4JF04_PERFH|nr:hypothetical protein C2S53_012808 [Perilla frutescens var. hirtella]
MAFNLESLITILQQILSPEQTRWILDDHNKPQLESLLQKAVSLKQIHEKSPVPKIESLESRIREAAHKAEDIIESHMVDQVLCSRPEEVRFTFSTADDDLQQVMQELDSAMEQVVKLVEGKKISTDSSSSSGASFSTDPSWKTVVVGIDEDLMQLKDRLSRMQSKLEIIPIVGMGGIGKTTLARKLYNDPLIVTRFEYCGWITISQDYNVRAILLGLLGCIIGKLSSELIGQKDHQLKDMVYKELYGRRYLIVLDDMWSTSSWDDMRWCFPDCNNGSRIVLTTRESGVAKYADSRSVQHQMQLLNKSDSWNLLNQIVFGEDDDCPDVLQGIGRKIVNDCGGLPLAINVIGGLLCNSERSRDAWEHIAKDVRVAIAETGDQFSNILSLSYNHLPNHLRPCFLYMGAFPEDHEIKASRLVRLWVAEGFLKENGEKSLEEEAEVYLKALVERNLVSVRRNKGNGKGKSYGIHDLLRDLCMRKADEEKFLHVKNARVQKLRILYSMRRVSAHTSYRIGDMFASAEFMSLARSFLCTGLMSREILSPIFFASRLLRVLDVFEMEFPEFPREILQLVNLRFLALSYKFGGLPSEISRLWNLQTLIARFEAFHFLPSQIWEMSELRHLKLKDTQFWIEYGYRKTFVQKKLQTISTVNLDHLISRGFLGYIPNIKNLGICCRFLPSSAVDLRHLHKLQTLKCSFDSPSEGDRSFVATLIFPSSLRKLSLCECAISHKVLTTLCALPDLEVLKLRKCVFDEDEEWDAATQGDAFGSLQFLLLESLNVVRWRADETNFPKLRQLVIRGCSRLEEIPCGIGEILTLQLIELDECSPSAVASARQIQEVQRSDYENYDLQLRIS